MPDVKVCRTRAVCQTPRYGLFTPRQRRSASLGSAGALRSIDGSLKLAGCTLPSRRMAELGPVAGPIGETTGAGRNIPGVGATAVPRAYGSKTRHGLSTTATPFVDGQPEALVAGGSVRLGVIVPLPAGTQPGGGEIVAGCPMGKAGGVNPGAAPDRNVGGPSAPGCCGRF